MLWGKSIWSTVHVVALGFPESPTDTDRDSYRIFYNALGTVLPCSKCQENYARHMSEVPIDYYLFSKQQLFDWTVKLHNIVNAELGKPVWTHEQAWAHYSTGAYAINSVSVGTKTTNIGKPVNILLLVANLCVFIVVVVCLLISRKKR
jgi:hypothetical protein